jgi:hypothetical protein
MYENPRVSRPLPLIWGWVFDAAASTLVSRLGVFHALLRAGAACPLVSTLFFEHPPGAGMSADAAD